MLHHAWCQPCMHMCKTAMEFSMQYEREHLWNQQLLGVLCGRGL